MFKKGDIVVIEHIGHNSGYYRDGLEGSIIQLESNHEHTFGADFIILFNTTQITLDYCCDLQVRKIDRPLKFRGGKVINVEEASTPF